MVMLFLTSYVCYIHTVYHSVTCIFIIVYIYTGPTLSQLDQLLPIGPAPNSTDLGAR